MTASRGADGRADHVDGEETQLELEHGRFVRRALPRNPMVAIMAIHDPFNGMYYNIK